MFKLFKKKQNVDNSTCSSKRSKETKKYIPSFGKADDFVKLYSQGDRHITIGKVNGADIGVTASNSPANDIIVINDDARSVERQCVIPTISQCRLSYVVYDPDNVYQNSIGATMRSKGYDIQVVDFSDKSHCSRLDLFEVINIIKSPYWISVILCDSLKCNDDEAHVAYNLFMAMMQYLLTVNEKVDIDGMVGLFNKIKNGDIQTMRDIEACSASKQYISKVMKIDDSFRDSILEKIHREFFLVAESKLQNPNIFTTTAHKKQTVFFVKRVPDQYKYLVTAMLFNLKTASVVCGNGEVNTLIIDTTEDKWYDRGLLANICNESGPIMGRGIAHMIIRGSIKPELVVDAKKLIVYMHSDDQDTRKFVYCYLPMDMQLSVTEKEEINRLYFNGKMPESALIVSPMSMEELDKIQDCIVIDTSRAARPFRCDRLG